MLKKYIVEFIGTFILLGVILSVVNQKAKWAAFAIGLTLTAMILWGGNISGGHFNPVVSFAFYLNKQLPANELIKYIIAQVLGASAAMYFIKLK